MPGNSDSAARNLYPFASVHRYEPSASASTSTHSPGMPSQPCAALLPLIAAHGCEGIPGAIADIGHQENSVGVFRVNGAHHVVSVVASRLVANTEQAEMILADQPVVLQLLNLRSPIAHALRRVVAVGDLFLLFVV